MNFVIPAAYFAEMFQVHFSSLWFSHDSFLEAYIPEIDGEKLYQLAKKDGCLIEESFTPAESERHKFIRGWKQLEATDFFFDGEIDQEHDTVTFYAVFSVNVDHIFGTNVETDRNDDYLNVYACLDTTTFEVQDELQIVLWQNDDSKCLSYFLSEQEKAIILGKMDAHMQSESGISYACPLCGNKSVLQLSEYSDGVWNTHCEYCNGESQVTLVGASPELDVLIDYCRGRRVLATPYYKYLQYHCGPPDSAPNLTTISNCQDCSKQGCHIHTAAQDAELLINGEKSVDDLNLDWRAHHAPC